MLYYNNFVQVDPLTHLDIQAIGLVGKNHHPGDFVFGIAHIADFDIVSTGVNVVDAVRTIPIGDRSRNQIAIFVQGHLGTDQRFFGVQIGNDARQGCLRMQSPDATYEKGA